MSNSLAIATVTATLKNIIFAGIREELGNGTITTKSLERARENNVFQGGGDGCDRE
ncbi:MAG: hypothetical protein AAFY67_01845 [Cyanobacteria bacterium J06642_9]